MSYVNGLDISSKNNLRAARAKYLKAALRAHPNKGGSKAEFQKLHEAWTRAQHYYAVPIPSKSYRRQQGQQGQQGQQSQPPPSYLNAFLWGIVLSMMLTYWRTTKTMVGGQGPPKAASAVATNMMRRHPALGVSNVQHLAKDPGVRAEFVRQYRRATQVNPSEKIIRQAMTAIARLAPSTLGRNWAQSRAWSPDGVVTARAVGDVLEEYSLIMQGFGFWRKANVVEDGGHAATSVFEGKRYALLLDGRAEAFRQGSLVDLRPDLVVGLLVNPLHVDRNGTSPTWDEIQRLVKGSEWLGEMTGTGPSRISRVFVVNTDTGKVTRVTNNRSYLQVTRPHDLKLMRAYGLRPGMNVANVDRKQDAQWWYYAAKLKRMPNREKMAYQAARQTSR